MADRKVNKVTFKTKEKGGIYCIQVYPGNFLDQSAFVKGISTTDELEYYQKAAIKNIKAVSTLKPFGYSIVFKIPFIFLGFEEAPVDGGQINEIGCTFVLHDIDNEFRPEEETVMASSVFDSSNPASYGSLIFYPQDEFYGESANIYKEDILKLLSEFGF